MHEKLPSFFLFPLNNFQKEILFRGKIPLNRFIVTLFGSDDYTSNSKNNPP